MPSYTKAMRQRLKVYLGLGRAHFCVDRFPVVGQMGRKEGLGRGKTGERCLDEQAALKVERDAQGMWMVGAQKRSGVDGVMWAR